jgi:glycosyltransferase involved in cell wall biosynthesis
VLAAQLERASIPFTPLVGNLVKRRVSLRFAARLRRFVRSGDFDVVHAHGYASTAAAAFATVATDVALVATEHTEGPWRGRGARLFSHWLYRQCTHVVAVSSAIRRQLEDTYRVPPPRVTFVLPALAGARGVRRPSRADVFPPTWTCGPVVGRVARLVPEKGVDVFLRAAAHVAGVVPEARFAVVGDGPARETLERLATGLGLRERLCFLGYRPDARPLMSLLDVLAVSSLSDGAPLVVLEAMEAGVPVVASAVGGIVDQIRHDREGLLVPPGDDRALAAALLALVDDPVRAARLGGAARRRAAEFSHDRMVARLERVYRSALGPAPATAPASAAPGVRARSAAG